MPKKKSDPPRPEPRSLSQVRRFEICSNAGKARAKSLTQRRRSQIARMGGLALWKKYREQIAALPAPGGVVNSGGELKK